MEFGLTTYEFLDNLGGQLPFKMVEGGVVTADKTEFTECWKTTWKTPYIMRLSFSAGIGGFLFGYDTGTFVVFLLKLFFFFLNLCSS